MRINASVRQPGRRAQVTSGYYAQHPRHPWSRGRCRDLEQTPLDLKGKVTILAGLSAKCGLRTQNAKTAGRA